MIDKQGVSPDPHKHGLYCGYGEPQNSHRVLGIYGNGKPTGEIHSKISQPPRKLLSSKRLWLWGPSQHAALKKLKHELTQPTVLIVYDPDAKQKIAADASAYRLGAVLLQQYSATQWKPIVYASRSMSDIEKRYSQTEKEALAIVWACKKFLDYIVGKLIQLETDHKPLAPLLSITSLDRQPP